MSRYLIACMMLILTMPIATATAEQERSPRLSVELKQTQVMPGQPVTLEMTILVPTWMTKTPLLPNIELPDMLIRRPPKATYAISPRIDGKSWSGLVSTYLLYPMTQGQFRLPSMPVTVYYAKPGDPQGLEITLSTRPLSFRATVPPEARDLEPFIAAKQLTLSQTLDGSPGKLKAGDAVTRTVTATITGAAPLFIPPLIPEFSGEGIAAYPKQPLVDETITYEQTSGKRTEQVIYVAETGGRNQAPSVRLRWFNLATKAVETAELSGFQLVASELHPGRLKTTDWQVLLAWSLLTIMAITILIQLLRRFWPRLQDYHRQVLHRWKMSPNYAFHQLILALRRQDLDKTLRCFTQWRARLPVVCHPDLAPFEKQLFILGKARFGSQPESVNQAWQQARSTLFKVRVELYRETSRSTKLPSLNPN